MAIWIDMTNSLSVWTGGLVGIVRAELEIAKNLHAVNKDVRFCRAMMEGYIEVSAQELEWLWDSKQTGDAYLERMGRKTKEVVPLSKDDIPAGLKEAYEYSEGRYDRIKKFFEMLISRTPFLLRFIPYLLFGFILLPLKAASMTRMAFIRSKGGKENAKEIVSDLKKHPFTDDCMLFSAGWFSSKGIIKEKLLSQIKNELPNFRIIYLVYDLVLINEATCALYEAKKVFEDYLYWISNNCDYVFFGGNTAKIDAERYWESKGIPVKPGYFLKFGSDVARDTKDLHIDQVKDKYGITEDYILSVGTVDAKKNYSTLYHAYTMMADMVESKEIPQLVIVGGKYGDPVLSEMMELDPRVKDKIIFTRPSDDELALLYMNCCFTVLPTWYEGWSLTLPESLEYGKLCISSDVAPLREIAGDLVVYIDPSDARKWAESIIYYFNHPGEVGEYNKRIGEKYIPQRWSDCGRDLNAHLTEIYSKKTEHKDARLYYDLSLAYILRKGKASVSGILRTQLILARQLARIFPHMRFIGLDQGKYIVFDRYELSDLLSNVDIDTAFQRMSEKLRKKYDPDEKIKINRKYSNGQIFWMMTSLLPEFLRRKAIRFSIKYHVNNAVSTSIYRSYYPLPFEDGDVLFSTGTGYSADVYDNLRHQMKKKAFKLIQLIYDFTPTLFPQVHTEQTRKFYPMFLKNSYTICKEIFYGGETAMRDGEAYARENCLPAVKGFPVRFGSDITVEKNSEYDKEKFKRDFFERIGIHGRYILAVGSIEIRKNHESLYMAYLDMMKKSSDLPQMVFCGYPGWKTEEFLKKMFRDERVRGRIMIITPTDKELKLLYDNCDFTVLASLYEGWSLTLPESLNHGKLCITTDADPMREIGCDLLEYVPAYDIKAWSDAILKYYKDEELLREKEAAIREKWSPITWKDCAKNVARDLMDIIEERKSADE